MQQPDPARDVPLLQQQVAGALADAERDHRAQRHLEAAQRYAQAAQQAQAQGWLPSEARAHEVRRSASPRWVWPRPARRTGARPMRPTHAAVRTPSSANSNRPTPSWALARHRTPA
nr:hypothetical protein [Variovorax boronicumulans]